MPDAVGTRRGAGLVTSFNDIHSIGLALVPRRSRVLDIGCGNGTFAAQLATQGCTVWGVERDKLLAERATATCERVVVGDIDLLDLAELGHEPFDVIVCLDVIEHLVDPVETLRRLSTLLAPDGRLVASIANVAHGAARLAMLRGSLPETEAGLLNRAHLHLFDRRTTGELFDDAGYEVIGQLEVSRGLHDTDLAVESGPWSDELLLTLSEDPESSIYQWVVIAALPSGEAVTATPVEHAMRTLTEYRKRLEEDAAAGAALEVQVGELRQQFAAAEHEIEELREQLRVAGERAAELEQELRIRVDELDILRRDIVRLERAVSIRDGRFTEIQARCRELDEQAAELRARLGEADERAGRHEASRAEVVSEIEKIKAWPAYRALERYEAFRLRHQRLVAPFRWLARRLVH